MENDTKTDDITVEEVALAGRLDALDTDSLVPDPDTVVLHDDAEEPSMDDARTRVARHESLYPRLFWADGDAIQMLSVTGSSILIGRTTAAITIDNPEVSKTHACVHRSGDAWFVRDESSANGTFVDGNRVSEALLSSGSCFSVGGVTIWFLDPEDAVTAGDDIYCLDFKEGDRAGEIVDIEQLTTLGRAGCNVSFTDTGISSRHAEVRIFGANAVFVRDLGSSNGTFVNGVQVSGAMRLKPGDQVKLGQTVVALRKRGASRPEVGQPALMVEPTRLLTMEDMAEPEPEQDVPREAEQPPEAVVEPRPEISAARPSRAPLFIALAVLGAVVVAFVLWRVSRQAGVEKVQQLQVVAPSLAGLQVEQARKVLEPRGLTVVVTKERQGEQGEKKGVILSQMPPEGVKVKKGSSVSVVVSTGPARVAVPTLARMTIEQAKAALARQGLQVGTITREASGDVPKDQVIRSSPSSGMELEATASVELAVSDGVATAAVPEVVLKRLGAAKAAITEAGLTVGRIKYTYDDRRGRLVVLEQKPAAGQQVSRDTRVDLVVNEGD